MKLNFIETDRCPICGCNIVIKESVETEFNSTKIREHASGGRWEYRQFACGCERDAFEDELEEIKYYELCYFYGRKDSGSIYIKTTLDKDLFYEDEFLQKLVDSNELDASEVDAIVKLEDIDEETYHDMTGK